MPGTPRDWVFVQLGHYYFVRNQDWRLDELGRLHDMREAPFAETLLPADSTDPRAQAARRELQSVLAALRPEAGPTWDQWTGFTLNNVRHRGAELPRPDGTQ
jgi:hypothetical protein